MKSFKKTGLAVILLSALGFSSCDTPFRVTGGIQFNSPSWGAPYYNGCRYYYLPDIESYYDLSRQEFVYLDGGSWQFSPSLPSYYGGYDLYNSFIVTLNIDVFQPWSHHEYYTQHYPRYYYRNVYRDMNSTGIRGFNEWDRKPIYRPTPEPRRDWKPVVQPQVKQPQPVQYYNRRVGQPVRVRPHMKEINRPVKRPVQ